MPEHSSESHDHDAGAQKELRIALVCYGGLSLAVYMHGITKELLKLVRASRVLHGAKKGGRFTDHVVDDGREVDTECAYYDLLQTLLPRQSLRVIIDVVAGTSAGGINGIMLARALAHDLPLDAHRNMWLEGADIGELMDPRAVAGRWAKPFMRPLLWGLLRDPDGLNAEARLKISRLARSAWFRPPFSGARFTRMLLDALHAMSAGSDGARNMQLSLLPRGHTLSLFVTLTNYQGYTRALRIHDPVVVHEREHRHLLEFRYRMRRSGEMTSHFLDANSPALAFAARGTSSYGGLFPPLAVGEVDAALAERDEAWPGRATFLERQFRMLVERGESPEAHAFIDGGVLDNKPFEAAIRAIQGRPAQRQVDRRLLYIEPRPESLGTPPQPVPRGFFSVVRRSFADLPRAEPIRDSLAELEAHNEKARLLRRILAQAWPKVRAAVAALVAEQTVRGTGVDVLRSLAQARARSESGYAFDSYQILRLDDLASRILKASPPAPVDARTVFDTLLGAAPKLARTLNEPHADDPGTVLAALDLDYRIRKLRFVISRLNELYASADDESSSRLSELKHSLYERIGALHDARLKAIRSVPFDFERGPGMLASTLDLARHDSDCDALFEAFATDAEDGFESFELLAAYVGFPYFDVLSYGIARWSDVEELDEVKVMRISAEDATSIRAGGAKATLKGIKLFNFGGFFSRAYRENDYLWGRLHAAERLVDLIVDAAGAHVEACGVDIAAVKCRLFETILDAEAPHLGEIADEIERVRAEVATPPTAG